MAATVLLQPVGSLLPLVAVFAVYLVVRLIPGWRHLLASLAACGIAFAVPVAEPLTVPEPERFAHAGRRQQQRGSERQAVHSPDPQGG